MKKNGKKGKTKNKNVIMLVTLGILAVAIVLIAVIGSMGKGGEKVPSVEVVSVKKGNINQEVEATGNVESELKKTFFSPVNATIQTMTVEAGDSVEAEQTLIGFNLENLESENQRAELNVKSGQLDIQDAQQQAGTAAAKVGQAKKQIPGLESQIAQKKSEIDGLRQQIANVQKNAQDSAQAQLEKAQAEAAAAYEAAVTAAKQKYEAEMQNYNNVIKPEYDKKLEELRNKVNSGEGTVADQEDYRYVLGNPPAQPVEEVINPADFNVSADIGVSGAADTSDLQFKMETASSELAQLQSELASKKAMAEADTPGLTSAAKEKMRIANNLSELESKNIQELLEEGREGIKAEFKGVISDARVTQGATVSQGMELFTLQSIEQVCVDANISKYDFDKVHEGQKATVTLGSKKYNGTINKVSRIAIPNEKGAPTIGITVHIDNPDDGIFIGVEAKVSIQAAEVKDVALLPVEVVNIGKDGSFCYVIEDGVITKKNVETGITSNSYVEVKSGLEAGEQVIKDIGKFNEGDAVMAKESKEKEKNFQIAGKGKYMGNIVEYVKMAIQNILANKGRSFLTKVGNYHRNCIGYSHCFYW